MSDNPEDQDNTQQSIPRNENAFDMFLETHSAPSSQHVSYQDYHQEGSSFLFGMQQGVEASGVTTSNTSLQETSSANFSTEERVDLGIDAPKVSRNMQFFTRQAPKPTASDNFMPKKLNLNFTTDSEPADGYKRGGFCPINVGDVLNSELVIIKKLGYGGFSTVWMAWHYVIQKYVALKITKSAERFKAMAEVELNFLEICTIAHPNAIGANNVVRVLSSFTHNSENGNHIVMVFEIHGPSLFSVLHLSNQKVIHLEQVRRICRQLLEAVSFLHDECGITHSDIKPENIMVAVSNEDVQKMDPNSPVYVPNTSSFDLDFTNPDSRIQIMLCDLGVSCWANNTDCPLLQSCSFRAPEVFLKGKTGTAADMWSVGCVAFELITGQPLFSCSNRGMEIDEATNHLSQMYEIIGTIPFAPYRTEHNTEFLRSFFNTDGKFINKTPSDPNRLINKMRGYRNMTSEDAAQCAQFVLSLLKLDPKERPTAIDALTHPFLLPFGGKSSSSFEKETSSDHIYPHSHPNVAETNLCSVAPLPNGSSSPIQSPNLSGSDNESNNRSGSSIVTVVESSTYKQKTISKALSALQIEHLQFPSQ